MLRKFECWNCKKTFQADAKGAVECPHCHSDNVDYATFRVPRQVFMFVAVFVLIIIATIGITYILLNENKNVAKVDTGNPNQENRQRADSLYMVDGGEIQPQLSIFDIEYNEDDNTYNCSFMVDYPPQQPWKIVIKSYYDEKFVAESETGKFEHLPYSHEDGFYRVFLVCQSTNEELCEARDFPNFPKQSHIKKPWSVADLERSLNGEETIVDNPFIAPLHKVVVVNKHSKDTTPTSSLGQVQGLLKMASLKATVEKVEYDDMNRICIAKIRINYPADWMEEDDW